jgi:hypothetical protein
MTFIRSGRAFEGPLAPLDRLDLGGQVVVAAGVGEQVAVAS